MTTETLVPAGFWRRAGAKLCDWSLVFALQLLLIALVAGVDVFYSQRAEVVLGFFIGTAVVQILYFAYGNANRRRTWGYRLGGLQLETLQGAPVSLGRSLWRSVLSNLASTLFVYGGFLDFLCAGFNRNRRTGHDFASGTRVVSVAKTRSLALWRTPALLFVFFALWIADVIFPSALRAFYIPSGAMENTLRVNDRLLVNLLTYRFRAPQNGEIAVFKAPTSALLKENATEDIDFIKRVVGTPGDVVMVVNRQLFRNGASVREPYTKWSEEKVELENFSPRYSYDLKIVAGAVYSREYLGPKEPGLWTHNNIVLSEKDQQRITEAKPGKVPQNQFLMLGDYRANSNDSHVWGFVPREAFVGRAINTFWPNWKTLR